MHLHKVLYECMSYMCMFTYRMEGTQHCLCMGGCCLHEKVAKEPGLILREHVYQVRAVIGRCLDDMPNSCPRFEENQTLFLLLTLRGDLK